jgi:hypothetical protein
MVVGLAVGLRLERASVGEQPDPDAGWIAGAVWFSPKRHRQAREAWAIMFAAGVVWDAGLRLPGLGRSYDAQQARLHCSGRRGYQAVCTAAAAILAGRMPEHARVTRALLERDLTGLDVVALCHGELDV